MDFQSRAFHRRFFYSGSDLGASYRKTGTSFKVWAPTAEQVALRLYSVGTGGAPLEELAMEAKNAGTWAIKMPGDLDGMYYTYVVTIGGETTESADIYAKTCGMNGERGMIVDFATTDPDGWKKSKRPALRKPNDAVIYELHVRDFSIDEGSSFINKGLFLAFTQTGLKNAAGQAIGIDHIKELGITHVHLLPCFDYNSVDESNRAIPQFNWGYDPKNYNCLEGSYSTDPNDGAVRIKEFKQLVLSLHEQGIGIIMDVVYNHTGETENSSFNKLVPEYYYRQNSSGGFSNGSECGNETASERLMFRKFMVDSVVFWAKEYKLDGFRFDLMGLHDIATMNTIRVELDKINPNILIYGEGWTAGETPLTVENRAVKANARSMPGIAFFSDDIRDGIRGHVFEAKEKGFVNGGDMEETIKFGVVGGVKHGQIDYSKVKYSNSPWAKSPGQVINYCEAHDNLTLWDKLAISADYASEEDRKKMDMLAAAIVFTSQGIPFIQAGQEFLRSKPKDGGFDENSYASSDAVNSLKWDRKSEYDDVYNYYKGLIALRKAHPALRLETAKDVSSQVRFFKLLEKNTIGFRISTDRERMTIIYNASHEDKDVKIPHGRWNLYVRGNQAGREVLEKINGGHIIVPALSAMVLGKSHNVGLKKTLITVGAACATYAAIQAVSKDKECTDGIKRAIPRVLQQMRTANSAFLLANLAIGTQLKKKK